MKCLQYEIRKAKRSKYSLVVYAIFCFVLCDGCDYKPDGVRGAVRSARAISSGIENYVASNSCFPAVEGSGSRSHDSFVGWRREVHACLDSHRALSPDELQKLPAGVFSLVDYSDKSTRIYAISGKKTFFSEAYRCNHKKFSGKAAILVSGKPSAEPWYLARDAPLEQLERNEGSLADCLGESFSGVAIVVFSDYDVWVIRSSVPSSLIASCANLEDGEQEASLKRLGEYRITVK